MDNLNFRLQLSVVLRYEAKKRVFEGLAQCEGASCEVEGHIVFFNVENNLKAHGGTITDERR